MRIIQNRAELKIEMREVMNAANVFYSEDYMRLAEESDTTVCYALDDAYIQVISLHDIRKFFRVANFPSEPIAIQGGDDFESQQRFLNSVVQLLKEQLHIDWITVTPASSVFISYPTESERIRFGNYIIDLTPDTEQLFSNLSSKHRNMVRRGERGGITIRFGGVELLQDYIAVDRQTWARSGQKTDHTEYYQNYLKALGSMAIIGMAYKDGVPQCGLIGLYNSRMFYYMFGASADRPEPGSTHFLQWSTILRMKENGVRFYNFVGCRIDADPGSKYENIQHFKKGFGGVLKECYLFRVTLNKKKKWLFDQLMRIAAGKKPNDVIDQEIQKWRDIN